MDMQEWLRLFAAQVSATPAAEWVAVLLSMISVLLARANHVGLYPAGIASTALFTWLFIRPGTALYAEGLLNAYYFVMSIYGWRQWVRRKGGGELPVTVCSPRDRIITAGIVLFGWTLLYIILSRLTDSDVPVWDAWVSATAWAGMWLLARRKLENWILLNISNFSAVPLLFYKEMPLTALLTVFLFVVAVSGFFRWRKIYRSRHAHAPGEGSRG